MNVLFSWLRRGRLHIQWNITQPYLNLKILYCQKKANRHLGLQQAVVFLQGEGSSLRAAGCRLLRVPAAEGGAAAAVS